MTFRSTGLISAPVSLNVRIIFGGVCLSGFMKKVVIVLSNLGLSHLRFYAAMIRSLPRRQSGPHRRLIQLHFLLQCLGKLPNNTRPILRNSARVTVPRKMLQCLILWCAEVAILKALFTISMALTQAFVKSPLVPGWRVNLRMIISLPWPLALLMVAYQKLII